MKWYFQGTYSCSKKIVKCTIFFNSVQNFLIVYTIWMYRLVIKSANKDNNTAFLKYLNLAFIGLQGKYTSSHISRQKWSILPRWRTTVLTIVSDVNISIYSVTRVTFFLEVVQKYSFRCFWMQEKWKLREIWQKETFMRSCAKIITRNGIKRRLKL